MIAMKAPDEAKRRAECARNTANNPLVRATINAKVAKAVICLETLQEFQSIASAVMWLHKIGKTKSQKSKISQAAKGVAKTAYGFTWKYI